MNNSRHSQEEEETVDIRFKNLRNAHSSDSEGLVSDEEEDGRRRGRSRRDSLYQNSSRDMNYRDHDMERDRKYYRRDASRDRNYLGERRAEERRDRGDGRSDYHAGRHHDRHQFPSRPSISSSIRAQS